MLTGFFTLLRSSRFPPSASASNSEHLLLARTCTHSTKQIGWHPRNSHSRFKHKHNTLFFPTAQRLFPLLLGHRAGRPDRNTVNQEISPPRSTHYNTTAIISLQNQVRRKPLLFNFLSTKAWHNFATANSAQLLRSLLVLPDVPRAAVSTTVSDFRVSYFLPFPYQCTFHSLSPFSLYFTYLPWINFPFFIPQTFFFLSLFMVLTYDALPGTLTRAWGRNFRPQKPHSGER